MFSQIKRSKNYTDTDVHHANIGTTLVISFTQDKRISSQPAVKFCTMENNLLTAS